MKESFDLSDYEYELPEKLIAQHPLPDRDQSRLMVVRGASGPLEVMTFSKIFELLPEKSVIVVNNSRVFPARLRGKQENLALVELVLLSPLDLLRSKTKCTRSGFTVQAHGLVRPSKAIKSGTRLYFKELQAVVLNKGPFGQCTIRMEWSKKCLADILAKRGEVPLPPYIKRAPDSSDRHRYQTVYAKDTQLGSVAAPTAGLHFTKAMQAKLAEAGHIWCELTLHVGYGTFSPIRCDDVRNHAMHAEYVRISEEAAEMLNGGLAAGRPIIAVGTTAVRTLEGVIAAAGTLRSYEGWLNTYIYPGFTFKAVSGLITNFHMPRSSLLVLVSAFAGRERILSAYRKAVEEKMRFFSYGDAMFIDLHERAST